MTFSDWAPPAATVLGAAAAGFGGWIATRQRERADKRALRQQQRTESRQWFALALAELADGDNTDRRRAGRAILEAIADGELTAPEDRALARTLLTDDSSQLTSDTPAPVDTSTARRDTEGNGSSGGTRWP